MKRSSGGTTQPDIYEPNTGRPLFQRLLDKLKGDRDPATGDMSSDLAQPMSPTPAPAPASAAPAPAPAPAAPAAPAAPEPAPEAPSAGMFDTQASQQWAGLPDDQGRDYYYDYKPAKGNQPATIAIHGGHRGIVPITITNEGRHADAFQAILREAADLDDSGTPLKPYIPVEELRKTADQSQTVETVGRDAFADTMGPDVGPPSPFGESSTAERKVDTRTSPRMPSEPPTSERFDSPSEDMTGPLTAPYDNTVRMNTIPIQGERPNFGTSPRMPTEPPTSPRPQELTPDMRAALTSPGTTGRPAQNRAQRGADALDDFAQNVMSSAGSAAGRLAAKDAALTGSDNLNRAQNLNIRIQNALQAGNAEEAAKLSEQLNDVLKTKPAMGVN